MTPRKNIAVAIVKHRDHFLVGRRSADVPLPGKDEFPGGKVEPGETPAAAAVRECFEETNVAAEIDRLLAVVDHDYEDVPIRIHFFVCRPISDAGQPTAPFRWVARSSLAECDFPTANLTIFQQLLQAERPS